jgi:hypothetical protein
MMRATKKTCIRGPERVFSGVADDFRENRKSDLGRFDGQFNLSVFLLKFLNALPDQVQNLSVDGTVFVLGDVFQFTMQSRIDFNAEMLVLFISHCFPPEASRVY